MMATAARDQLLLVCFVFCGLKCFSHGYVAKQTIVGSRAKLLSDLQSCYTAHQVLDRVGRHVTSEIDEDGTLASLVWVRLCKHLIHEENRRLIPGVAPASSSLSGFEDAANAILSSLTAQGLDATRTDDRRRQDAAVELTKAASVVSRLGTLPNSMLSPVYESISEFWNQQASRTASGMQTDLHPHQLSGLKWGFDCFSVTSPAMFSLPDVFLDAYNELRLPFTVIPGCISHDGLTVSTLIEQVDFRVDEIRTQSNELVAERRQTAWQGDEGVPDFVYSSKCMPRQDWSPLVLDVRDQLNDSTYQYYDCCLLNLYPNGGSGMRYHTDPDQGKLWDYDTAVVSVGATRRVAFRNVAAVADSTFPVAPSPPHSFHVLHGDVMYMLDDCQDRFQHTVKKAETKGDDGPRSSLVFKRTWKRRNTALSTR
jgi:alkylated DNA repair dioxygenase AlkB